MYIVNEKSILLKQNVSEIVGISSTGFIAISTLNLFILVFGLIGNTAVVYGNKKRHIFKMMDPMTGLCLETIALADILIILMFFLPMYLTLVGNRWLLGTASCWFVGHFRAIPLYTEILVTATMTVNRAVILQKPNKNRRNCFSTGAARTLLVIASFVLGAIPSLLFLLLRSETYFDAFFLSCVTSKYLNKSLALLNTVVMVIFVMVPVGVIIFANSYILVTVLKSNKRTRTSATRTVTIILVISWIFVASYIPFPIFTALQYYDMINLPWIGILSIYISSANLIINPIVYFFVSPRFRNQLNCSPGNTGGLSWAATTRGVSGNSPTDKRRSEVVFRSDTVSFSTTTAAIQSRGGGGGEGREQGGDLRKTSPPNGVLSSGNLLCVHNKNNNYESTSKNNNKKKKSFWKKKEKYEVNSQSNKDEITVNFRKLLGRRHSTKIRDDGGIWKGADSDSLTELPCFKNGSTTNVQHGQHCISSTV
ncbi:hypothetical protein ACHWQZ_G019219 [Mnemiopsis leidyi]